MIGPGIGPAWQFCVDNLVGTPLAPGVMPGTAFTAGGSNVDGAAVSVLGALAADVQLLTLQATIDGLTGEDNSSLMDLLYDPAGGTSWQPLVADLIIGSAFGAVGQFSHRYAFPLYVKAGATIGVQARKNGATNAAGKIVLWAYGQPRRPEMWWCGVGVESLGINAASSKGTTHTPGATGTFSAWATVGASSRRYGALQLGAQMDSNALNARGYHGQVGAGGAQLPGTGTQWMGTSTTEMIAQVDPGPMPVDVAAGTTLQYRATCSGTANDQNVALYGTY